MKQRMPSISPGKRCRYTGIRAIAGLLLLGSILTGWAASKQAEPVENPHKRPAKCVACHVSQEAGKGDLRFEGDVMKLCQSCHNSKLARTEGHPAGMVPSAEMKERIPSNLPLDSSVLGCLTCHDITGHCKAEKNDISPNGYFLRQGDSSVPFCFLCHAQEAYTPYNVHDQLDDGKMKVETCSWCHPVNAAANPQIDDAAFSKLSGKAHDLCRKCHTVERSHPADAPHMHAKLSEDMVFYISAYELRAKMRTSLPKLKQYVRAAKRQPQSIPFDEDGAVTCYSCHNPHEKGLLPDRHPRSLGAGPKKAVHHRLRAREGNMCIVCHDK